MIDLWKIIQDGDFFTIEDPKTKFLIEKPFIRLKDDEKRKLDKDYYNKNHVRKFLCILSKVTTIKEAKDLAIFPLDELIGNLKDEIILENNGVVYKTTKEKVKSLALIAKVIREQTSDESDNQDGCEGNDKDEEEFNLMVKNFRKFFMKGVKILEALNETMVVMVAVARTTSLMIVQRRGEKGVRWWNSG
nr:hypothetical protein [Tanacetum cinerariifolium]